MSYFNLFLRGRPGQELPFQVNHTRSGPFVSTVTYPFDLPFREIRELLPSCRAPFLVFADTSLGLGPAEWATLAQAAAASPEEVHGYWPEGKTRIYGEGNAWPSWLLVLPAQLAQEVNWAASGCESLEYVLMEAALQLNRRPLHVPLGLGGFDPADWIYRQLLQAPERMAQDFRLLLAHHGKGISHRIPPQFRVETAHRQLPVELLEVTASNGNGSALNGESRSPFFSIVCPVFKSAYLQELIDSVKAQTHASWELILGVDGPPEPALTQILEILGQESDPRIRYFIQENQGTGPTRRRLSECAEGKFVLSVDDDDLLVPDTLQTFYRACKTIPQGRVFRAAAETFGLLKASLPVRPRYLVNGIPNDPFEVNQPYVIQRELIHELGGYEWDADLHNAGEDTVLFHKIDAEGIPVYLIDKPLYRRRLSTHNLTLHFKVEEALAHFANLDRRFCPSRWANRDRKFEMDGNVQRARAIYSNEDNAESVVTGTRFFQFQTLGDLNDLIIDLEITARCNAVCGFCPREAMPDTRTHISMETVEALAADLRHGPRRQVVLCGIGESLLHPKLLEIVETLRDAGAFLAMTSNGALMTENKFMGLIQAGVLSFNFSLNAATAGTHEEVMGMKNYGKVIKNVRRALELKQEYKFPSRIHVSFVVCERNAHEVQDFVQEWRGSGVDEIWLHPVNNRAGLLGAGLKSTEMQQFADLYAGDPIVSVDIFKDHEERDNLCKIAKSLAFISSNGEMRLCAMDYRRATSHGNIKENSLQQMHFEKLLKFVRGGYNDFCQGCDFCPAAIRKESVPVESRML